MLKTLKDLVLAFVNATLILVVLSLFLAWRLTLAVDGMVGNLAENLTIVDPLRADLQTMTREVAALRDDLDRLAGQTGEISDRALEAVNARLDQMQGRLDRDGTRMDELAALPGRIVQDVIETALDTAAERLSRTVQEIRQCTATPPDETS